MFDYSRIDKIDPDFLEQYVDMTKTGREAFRCPVYAEREIECNGVTYEVTINFGDALGILWNEYAYDLTGKWGKVKRNFRAHCLQFPEERQERWSFLPGRRPAPKPTPEGLDDLRVKTHCYLLSDVVIKEERRERKVFINEEAQQLTHEQVRKRVLCFVAMMARLKEDDALKKIIENMEVQPQDGHSVDGRIAHLDLWNEGCTKSYYEVLFLRFFVYVREGKLRLEITFKMWSFADPEKDLAQKIDLFNFPEGEGSGVNPPKLRYAAKPVKKPTEQTGWFYLPRRSKNERVKVQLVEEKNSYVYYSRYNVGRDDRVVIGYPYADDNMKIKKNTYRTGIVQECSQSLPLKTNNAVNLAYAFGRSVTKRSIAALAEQMDSPLEEGKHGMWGSTRDFFGYRVDFPIQDMTRRMLAAITVLAHPKLAAAESVARAQELLQAMPLRKEEEKLYQEVRKFYRRSGEEYGFEAVAGSMLDEPELIREREELIQCRAMLVYDSDAYVNSCGGVEYEDCCAVEKIYSLPIRPKDDRLVSDYLNRCAMMNVVGVMMNNGLSEMLKTYLLACPPIFGCVKAMTEYAGQKGVSWAATLLEAYRKGDMDAIRNFTPQNEQPIRVKFTEPKDAKIIDSISIEETCKDFDVEKCYWMRFETEMRWAERAGCSDAQRIAWMANAANVRDELEKELADSLPENLEGKRFMLLGFDGDLATILTQRIQALGGEVLTKRSAVDYAVLYARSAEGGAEKNMQAIRRAKKQAQLVSDRTLWRALVKNESQD